MFGGGGWSDAAANPEALFQQLLFHEKMEYKHALGSLITSSKQVVMTSWMLALENLEDQ